MNKEQLKKLLADIGEDQDISDDSYEFEGAKYGFEEIEVEGLTDEDWTGGGKYQSKYQIFQLVKLDEKWKSIEVYDLFVGQEGIRTGSYYTEYYTTYEREILERIVEYVPEKTVVIPAHNIFKYVNA